MMAAERGVAITDKIICPSANGDAKNYKHELNNGHRKTANGKVPEQPEQGGGWQEDFCESFEETPLLVAILTYLGYAVMIIIGHVHDFLRRYGMEKDKSCTEPVIEGYCPILVSWESFFTRNMYRHARDCWNRPVCSAPSATFEVMERVSYDDNWNIL